MANLPTNGQAGAVSTLCGAVLMLDDIETVGPGEGIPCTVCIVNHVTSTVTTGEPPAGRPDCADEAVLPTGGIAYQQWSWPVAH